MLAEIEPDMVDELPSDVESIVALEREVYSALKCYMRLMKRYGRNKDMRVSKATKASRPTLFSDKMDNRRRTAFSFALANMIQMSQTTESQLLLQTTDIAKRLDAEKRILLQAAELIGDQLISMDVITKDERDEIKIQSHLFNDDDSDILPADVEIKAPEKEEDEWDLSQVM